jgi:hypothetical protein
LPPLLLPRSAASPENDACARYFSSYAVVGCLGSVGKRVEIIGGKFDGVQVLWKLYIIQSFVEIIIFFFVEFYGIYLGA